MKSISMLKILIALLVFTTFSCEDEVVDKPFVLGFESSFRINHEYVSDDGLYKLIINEITDSRCPEGVNCVWAGEVIIKGEFTDFKKKSSFEIHSAIATQQKQPEGYIMQIIDVRPYPKNGVETKPEDKLITLLIKKS